MLVSRRDFTSFDAGQRSVSSVGIYLHSPEFRLEHSHDGRRDGGARGRLLRVVDRVCLRLRAALRRSDHDF